MKLIRHKKIFGLGITGLCVLLIAGCASQPAEEDPMQSQIRASERALEDCQARAQTAEERMQRAEHRAEELKLRAEELERRMARMEARMSSKG